MPVMTRKATAQDMELKLKTALQELKESKLQCQQILQENEESEREIKKIVFQNTSLKRELVGLSQQLQEVVDERDQLRAVTDGFSACSDLYEEALCKVRDLEDELVHANCQIHKLQKEMECIQTEKTNHLYDELVNSNCRPHSLVTIDLTEDSLIKHNNYKLSKNKVKKYARLNKIIKKIKIYKKQQNNYSKNIQLRKDRVNLINQLHNYEIKLEDSINIYKIDTEQLQSEILTLNNSLKSIYSKYICSQSQIKEHILATNDLVDRVDSLTVSINKCTCQRDSNQADFQLVETKDKSQAISAQDCVPSQVPHIQHDLTHGVSSVNCSFSSDNSGNYQSIIFSDSIGRGLGQLVSGCLPFSSQNYCTPQATYHHVMSLVGEHVYNPNSILTVFVGNSINVRIDDITNSVTNLLKINCKKIILCAFPYFKHLSYNQNKYIHMLNEHMQFLVHNHSDKFIFYDINNFVDKLLSTRYTVYLPIVFRRKIAKLLAFIINTDIGRMSKYPFSPQIFSNSTNDKAAGSVSLN
ncbi:hypothetical protein PYW08_005433 [Mythimna loreyi]|uniref:Uncharacterized protein n=1 Tax=Mythimna loreyi TaxID=667449 RepID=A0ACC2QJ38_9NEOP|nr:hypothetical protein PYW08_005433 [Mythimna loreyi]